MKKTTIMILISAVIGLAGCATNKPFTPEQQTIIKQHKIVVRKAPEDNSERLMVLGKSNRAGVEVAGVVLGLLTGSFGGQSDGNTPRTRLQHNSTGQFLKVQARKASAEKIETITPTRYMQEMLFSKYQHIDSEEKDTVNKLVIDIKPVAWQLYYDDFFNGEDTFVLEYAGDIEMKLASAKLSRNFPCDKTSKNALSKSEWLANNHLRVRQFAQELAQECVNKVSLELGDKAD